AANRVLQLRLQSDLAAIKKVNVFRIDRHPRLSRRNAESKRRWLAKVLEPGDNARPPESIGQIDDLLHSNALAPDWLPIADERDADGPPRTMRRGLQNLETSQLDRRVGLRPVVRPLRLQLHFHGPRCSLVQFHVNDCAAGFDWRQRVPGICRAGSQ